MQPRAISSPLYAHWRLLRPRQWVKNGFVLAAVVFSGRFTQAGPLLDALLAALTFVLASAAVYVVNDIADRESDRNHPVKRSRPLASGAVSVPGAGLLGVVLASAAGVLASRFPAWFGLAVLSYVALNVLYSFWLKHVAILDVFSIALSFALRVVGGAAAIAVTASPWVLLCTMGLALFLAAAKRRQELILMEHGVGETRPILLQYATGFLDRLMLISVNLAVVTYCLFALTVRPSLAWGIPFVLYGIFRYYFLVELRGMGESPTEILLRDRPLLASVVCWFGLNVALIYFQQA